METVHTAMIIAGFVFTVVVQLIVAVWSLRGFAAGLEASFNQRIQVTKDEMGLRLESAVKTRDSDISVLRNEAGELGHAMRAKIHEVELYMRDKFVDRDDFKMHIDLLRDQISAILTNMDTVSKRIDARFESFAEKLDRL